MAARSYSPLKLADSAIEKKLSSRRGPLGKEFHWNAVMKVLDHHLSQVGVEDGEIVQPHNVTSKEEIEKRHRSIGNGAWSQYTICKGTRAPGQNLIALDGSIVVSFECSQG